MIRRSIAAFPLATSVETNQLETGTELWSLSTTKQLGRLRAAFCLQK